MKPLPASRQTCNGLPIEQRAAIRRCLNEVVVLRVGNELHATTYGAIEAFIAAAFFAGHTAIYDQDGRCIAVSYPHNKGYAPELAEGYARRLVRGGHLNAGQICALTGVAVRDIPTKYKMRNKRGQAYATD